MENQFILNFINVKLIRFDDFRKPSDGCNIIPANYKNPIEKIRKAFGDLSGIQNPVLTAMAFGVIGNPCCKAVRQRC